MRKTTPRNTIIKLFQSTDEEKILKRSQRKKIKMKVDLPSKPMQSRIQWNNIFKVPEEKIILILD